MEKRINWTVSVCFSHLEMVRAMLIVLEYLLGIQYQGVANKQMRHMSSQFGGQCLSSRNVPHYEWSKMHSKTHTHNTNRCISKYEVWWVRGMDPDYTHPLFVPNHGSLFAPNYTHFWNLHFPETVQPNSASSSLPMCVVLIPSMKENLTPQVEWFFRKKGGKKWQATHINHSINDPITWECV